MKKKNMSCAWTTISIYCNKLQKQIAPKFIHVKKINSKVIMLVHCISCAPYCCSVDEIYFL